MFSKNELSLVLFVYITSFFAFGDLNIGSVSEFSCENGNFTLKIVPNDYAKYGIQHSNDAIYISKSLTSTPNPICKDLINNFTLGVVFQVNSSECEAEIRELTTGYEFIYTLRAHENNTLVRRRNTVNRFICAYNKNYELQTSYETSASGSPLGSPLQSTPQLQMYVMRSDDNKVLNDGDTISSGTQLYVEVGYEPAEGEEGKYGIVLTSCTARSTESNDADSIVKFINNGCAVVNNIDTDNSELVVNSVGNNLVSSFNFTSFTWKDSLTNDQQQMTISCQAERCLIQGNSCNNPCNNKKVMKRRQRKKRFLKNPALIESTINIKTEKNENCKKQHCSDICYSTGKCGCFTGRVLATDNRTCIAKSHRKE